MDRSGSASSFAGCCALQLLQADDMYPRILCSALPVLCCVVAPVHQVQLPALQGLLFADLQTQQTQHSYLDWLAGVLSL